MGHWYDRTQQHAARQRGEKNPDEEQFALASATSSFPKALSTTVVYRTRQRYW